MFFRRDKAEPDGRPCAVCGKREGTVRIKDGFACRYCVPVNGLFNRPDSRSLASHHIRDAELIERIDSFQETWSAGDLRFDDDRRLLFKGPWPSYSIPMLSYDEIAGYRIIIDGVPLVFNSVDGKRAVFRATTDDAIVRQAKEIGEISLELDSSRKNVVFVPYEIFGRRQRISENRVSCLRLCIDLSMRLDSIVERNIVAKNNSDDNDIS